MFKSPASLSRAINPRTGSGYLVLARNFHRFSQPANPVDIAAAVRKDGACIISNFYNKDQIDRLNADIDAAMTKLAPGRPNLTTQPDEEFLKTFHGNQTRRLADLCTHSKTWREHLVDHDMMHAVCTEVIGAHRGDYWLSTAQMIQIGPGSEAQPLHVDGAQWWPFWEMGNASGNEMMLNFLVAGTKTTRENGATCVIPKSHRFEYAEMDPDSTEPPDCWRDEAAVPVELEAGDCLLIGGRIVHKGGANMTKDQNRRVLTVTVVNSAFTPEEASPLLVPRDVAKKLPERAAKFLGFRAVRPLGSIGIWSGPAEYAS